MKSRKGQIAVFLVMTLVVIVVLTLLNVDTFMSVRAKNRLQNAGDAAALAAARRQGSLVNEIGHLNIAHIVAAVRNRSDECGEIVLRQRRTALLEPVEGLRIANEAAKRNGMPVRDEFAEILRRHVRDIRLVYAGGSGRDGNPYPESFPGAWTEYATRIESVIGEGLAAGPDNVEFYGARGGHLLLNRQFYFAISGRDWCWFYFNCYDVLKNYSNYHNWDPLPDRDRNSMENSELFSLHVSAKKLPLTSVFTKKEILEILKRYSDEGFKEDDLDTSLLIDDPGQVWFFFEPDAWGQWFDGFALADDGDGWEFPVAGEIKPEYNVRGCAAILRCQNGIEPVAVNGKFDFTWSAAAKPFGTVEDLEGTAGPVTGLNGFVVPCMTEVRLVPVDSVGGENLATADYGWVTHVREHLWAYLEKGPRQNGCFYCQQLGVWELGSFRKSGVNWLKYNSHTCRRGTGGGPGGHGGTSHGH